MRPRGTPFVSEGVAVPEGFGDETNRGRESRRRESGVQQVLPCLIGNVVHSAKQDACKLVDHWLVVGIQPQACGPLEQLLLIAGCRRRCFPVVPERKNIRMSTVSKSVENQIDHPDQFVAHVANAELCLTRVDELRRAGCRVS